MGDKAMFALSFRSASEGVMALERQDEVQTVPLTTGNSTLCTILPHLSYFPDRLVVNVHSAGSFNVDVKGGSNHWSYEQTILMSHALPSFGRPTPDKGEKPV